MAMIALVCPACGSPLKMSDDQDSCFCQYCGTKVVKDKQFIEVSGQVSISRMAGESSLLERAFLFIEDGNFANADKYLERVLDINPKCAKAYIGKLLCSLQLRKIEDLGKQEKYLTSYDYYNRAMRFADAAEAQAYQELNNEIIARYKALVQKKQQDIAALEAGIQEKEQYLADNKSNYNKCIAKRVLWKVLLVLPICCTAFFTIVTMAILDIVAAVIDVLCIVWLVIMIIKNKKAKKSTEEYNSTKLQLQNDRIFLERKQMELNLVLATVKENKA